MAILSRAWRPLAATLVAVAAAAAAPARQASTGQLESDVKAAFVFNFTKYIEWPAVAFGGANEPFRVCVVADAAFAQSVERIIAGETIDGRALMLHAPEG